MKSKTVLTVLDIMCYNVDTVLDIMCYNVNTVLDIMNNNVNTVLDIICYKVYAGIMCYIIDTVLDIMCYNVDIVLDIMCYNVDTVYAMSKCLITGWLLHLHSGTTQSGHTVSSLSLIECSNCLSLWLHITLVVVTVESQLYKLSEILNYITLTDRQTVQYSSSCIFVQIYSAVLINCNNLLVTM